MSKLRCPAHSVY